MLLASPEIADIFEQPPAVHYADADGKWHHHTFDFLAIKRDGTKIAVVVKPEEIAEKRSLDAFIRLIAPQVPKSFADSVLLMDETDCDRNTLHDAVLIHDMLRHNDSQANRAIVEIVETLNGAATIRTLVDASGLGPRAFGAVVRMIAKGVLTTVNTRRIYYGALVRRVCDDFGELAR